MSNLVLVRHGQSEWNKENRFTGWVDVDLSAKGREEAKKAGELLKKHNIRFDRAFSSFLKRAIRSLWIILDQLDQMWVPVQKSWRLNERHYGELTGSNKQEVINKYGAKQVQLWRRDYKTRPPVFPTEVKKTETATKKEEPFNFNNPPWDIKEDISRGINGGINGGIKPPSPLGESLEQTKLRVLPFWESDIAPSIRQGQTVLVVAHGNSLRALIKHLEGLNDQDIMKIEIPTAGPIAYTLCTKTLAVKKAVPLFKSI